MEKFFLIRPTTRGLATGRNFKSTHTSTALMQCQRDVESAHSSAAITLNSNQTRSNYEYTLVMIVKWYTNTVSVNLEHHRTLNMVSQYASHTVILTSLANYVHYV